MGKSTMKGLAYYGPHDMRMIDKPIPQIIEATDAIVRVTRSTICGSDIHIQEGHIPYIEHGTIIGHEFCGEVVEVGSSVKNVKVGDRVAANCITSCGECFHCRKGEISHCQNGGWLFGHLADGCQTEYVRVPRANIGLYKIPDNLTEEDVLFVGDILSTGYFCAECGKIKPGDTVAVMGSGPVGLCTMISARLWGAAKIIAVDINDFRTNTALENGVADIALNPLKENVPERIRELTDGRGADVALEASGVKETYELCLESVRPCGNISIVGIFAEPQTLALDKYVGKNISISMGWVYSTRIPELINLIASGKINTNFLITHRAPLNDILKGYDIFGNKKDNCLKWVITPNEE